MKQKKLHHIFSNCCTHTTTSTPTTVYCYTALIKNGNMKKETFIKNKYNISTIHMPMHSIDGNIIELIPPVK